MVGSLAARFDALDVPALADHRQARVSKIRFERARVEQGPRIALMPR